MRNFIGPILTVVALAIMVVIGANLPAHSKEPYVCGKKAASGTVHAVYCGVQ